MGGGDVGHLVQRPARSGAAADHARDPPGRGAAGGSELPRWLGLAVRVEHPRRCRWWPAPSRCHAGRMVVRIRLRWLVVHTAVGSTAFAVLLALVDGADGISVRRGAQVGVPRQPGDHSTGRRVRSHVHRADRGLLGARPWPSARLRAGAQAVRLGRDRRWMVNRDAVGAGHGVGSARACLSPSTSSPVRTGFGGRRRFCGVAVSDLDDHLGRCRVHRCRRPLALLRSRSASAAGGGWLPCWAWRAGSSSGGLVRDLSRCGAVARARVHRHLGPVPAAFPVRCRRRSARWSVASS